VHEQYQVQNLNLSCLIFIPWLYTLAWLRRIWILQFTIIYGDCILGFVLVIQVWLKETENHNDRESVEVGLCGPNQKGFNLSSVMRIVNKLILMSIR